MKGLFLTFHKINNFCFVLSSDERLNNLIGQRKENVSLSSSEVVTHSIQNINIDIHNYEL